MSSKPNIAVIQITAPNEGDVLIGPTVSVTGHIIAREWDEQLDDYQPATLDWVKVIIGGSQVSVAVPHGDEPSMSWAWSCEGTVTVSGPLTIRAEFAASAGGADTECAVTVELPPGPEPSRAWLRLEPRCRSNDFARGLQARTADPLWMLARQWQTGEFQGEDAGSPLEVHLTYATQSLDRVGLGEMEDLDLSSEPLEKMVEQEWPALDGWKRVQAGQQFERFLLSELASDSQANLPGTIQAYREHYALELPTGTDWTSTDRATRRFLQFMRGRVVDGVKLLADIYFSDQDDHRVPAKEGIQKVQLDRVVRSFRAWCDHLNIRPSGGKPAAWRGEQLDYRFSVNPPAEVPVKKMHLVAPSYRSGDLDWHTFNATNVTAEKGWNQTTITATPTPIRILGTSPRWWAFEDAAIAIGQMDVAKPDLAKLILMEFMLIYGDDWFGVPLPIRMSSLVRIDAMRVTNVFGDVASVKPARKPAADALMRWELFTLSPLPDPAQIGVGAPDLPGVGVFLDSTDDTEVPVLLVPPLAGFRQESPPLEEIRFLRDEGANMVWAVEHIVQDGLGRPVSGFDAQRERVERRNETGSGGTKDEPETQPASADSPPRYRLATVVPENWIPFIPINAQAYLGYKGKRLRRAQMLRNTDDEAATAIPAMSRLLELEGDPLLWLEEATVLRAGLRYLLTAQRVRWVDGKTYVWLGRKVLAGRGEGSSGLRFDVLAEHK